MSCQGSLANVEQTARHFRAALIGLTSALALAPAALADPAPALPRDAVVLFGAHWCAPCTGELRDLDSLLARLAQAPQDAGRALVLAWIDRPASGAAVMRALARQGGTVQPRVALPPPALASAWAGPLLPAAHGLPFAVMTDALGKVCALHQGVTRAADIAEMTAACHGAK